MVGTSGSHRASMTADPVDSNQSANKPADGTEEGKSDVRLPLGAGSRAVERNAAPVEDISARAIQPIYHQAKGNKPHDRDDEVGRPVDEGAAKGEQPDDGQEDGKAGHHLGVDPPPMLPGRGTFRRVEVLARQAGHDGPEGDLRQAEDH